MKKRLFSTAAVAAIMSLAVGLQAQTSPEDAIRNYQNALSKGDIAALLELVPKAYISDATSVVNEFGGRMDADVWAQLRGMLGRASSTLSPKAAMLVEMASQGEEMTPEVRAARSAALGAAIASIGGLAGSEALNLDKLKTMDTETFTRQVAPLFSETAAAFRKLQETDPEMKKALSAEGMKSETLPSGNVAVTLGEETTEFTQVDGKWVPAEVAGSWDKGVKDIKAGIKNFEFNTPEGKQQKAQFMMILGMLDPMIQQLGTAQTPEEMQQKAGGLLMPLLMQGGGAGGLIPGLP